MATPEQRETLDRDLQILEQQEAQLRFTAFNEDTAWQLGSLLRHALLATNAGGTVEIELAGHLLFACAIPGAQPGQANWIRRKRNTVHHFARSTYAVGRKLERDGGTLRSRHGLAERDFAAHGGGLPSGFKAPAPSAASSSPASPSAKTITSSSTSSRTFCKSTFRAYPDRRSALALIPGSTFREGHGFSRVNGSKGR